MKFYRITTIAAVLQIISSSKLGSEVPTTSTLKLEINSERYYYCQLFVIREQAQNNNLLKTSIIPERITNPQLNRIIQENQKQDESETLLTWTVKDSYYEFLDVHRPFSPDHNSKAKSDISKTKFGVCIKVHRRN